MTLGVALHVLTGTMLLGGGAIALNQVIERKRDAAMRRTSRRPVASGRIRPASAALFGGVLAAAGLAYLLAFTGTLAAALGAFTLALYLLAYTPLKAITPYSTLVGAVAGALPPLIGWSAARGSVSLEAWVLFAILFFWQVPHFLALSWMYREDYERGGYLFLPTFDRAGLLTAAQMLLYSLALLVAASIPFFLGMTGLVYLVGGTVLSVLFAGRCTQFLIERSQARARGVFLWSLAYLPALAGLFLADISI
jgi:protoheme IX farnesyltransferase